MGMNFWKGNDKVCGVDWKVARDLCQAGFERSLEGDEYYLYGKYASKLSKKEIRESLSALEQGGYMEKTSDGWTTTVSGKRGPAVARWGKPISRKKAMNLLAFALNNACDYNASEAYPLMITAIRVYGSYLTDKDPLGDIDIAVEYKEREPYASKRGWEQSYSPSNLGFVESLFFPKYEMCRLVKGRQFAISIGCESIEWMGTPCVVIGFEEDGSRCQIAGVENIGGNLQMMAVDNVQNAVKIVCLERIFK